MSPFKTLMDVFKLLEKSNCKKCGEKTCLAFAAAVFSGGRTLAECPQVPGDVAALHADRQPRREAEVDKDWQEALAAFRAKVAALDLRRTAERIGGEFTESKLTLKVMGKTVEIDAVGAVNTEIHTTSWVLAPIYNYILGCKGTRPTGRWVPLRELPGGKDWYRLFGQTCEKPMKKVADTYSDLFADLVEIFNGKKVENHYQSDVALVLHPLPLLPLLICYWLPDEGLESNLNLFFDASAEDNLSIESIYSLGAGIARMFEKLAHRHGGMFA